MRDYERSYISVAALTGLRPRKYNNSEALHY